MTVRRRRISTFYETVKLELPDVDISTFRILQGSALIGKTLAQIELRRCYGVSVVAIRRDAQILSNPGADTLLQPNDELFVLGPPEKIAEATGLLHNPEEREMS